MCVIHVWIKVDEFCHKYDSFDGDWSRYTTVVLGVLSNEKPDHCTCLSVCTVCCV